MSAPDFARYCNYYREILARIAKGWPTPKSLADFALRWELHDARCSTQYDEAANCDCGAKDIDKMFPPHHEFSEKP